MSHLLVCELQADSATLYLQGYEGEKEAQEASDAADLAAANAAKTA